MIVSINITILTSSSGIKLYWLKILQRLPDTNYCWHWFHLVRGITTTAFRLIGLSTCCFLYITAFLFLTSFEAFAWVHTLIAFRQKFLNKALFISNDAFYASLHVCMQVYWFYRVHLSAVLVKGSIRHAGAKSESIGLLGMLGVKHQRCFARFTAFEYSLQFILTWWVLVVWQEGLLGTIRL